MGFFIFILIVIGASIAYFLFSTNLSLVDLIQIIYDSIKENSTNSANQNKFIEVDESQLNDDLSSAVGIDYRNLRNFLAVKDFESANKETKSLFQKISYIDLNLSNPDPEKTKTQRIPCTDICTIDRLWVKYSEEHFGISVQHKIHREIFINLYIEKKEFDKREKIERSEEEIAQSAGFDTWRKFNDIVGWKSADISPIYIYKDSAPMGHLPVIYDPHYIHHYSAMIHLFERLSQCLE
ncbi:GUN4 domain-containing protein [Aerosakkonema sp. BLCC-F183]|uniref:GUN4 domain-containing protein n=1 Tax=Aerosakkonema sp. BLCC-F183 TaxID=3342834 RepID=UPI0035B86725